MIPERSLAAKSAKSVLFEEFNEIDIFIEDTAEGYEKIFKELFSRVFQGKYKISKVFPLGERRAVIDEHDKNKNNFKRPTLYVIDGDLFLMLNNSVSSTKGLFVLPCYCIENILIDIGSIHQLLNEECHYKDKDDLIIEFDYSNWSKTNYEPLLKLFIEYAVIFSLLPEKQTVGYQVTQLVSSNNGIIDEAKTLNRINELQSEIFHKHDHETYSLTKAKVESIVKLEEKNLTKFVSGKDYLLPLLLTRFRAITRSRTSNINLKLRLAIKCDVSLLNEAINYVAI